jgi:hypothetical protein
MSRTSSARRAAAIVILAVLASACSKSLDTDGLESKLKSELETQLQASGVTVSCPTDVTVEQGGTFECTAVDDTGSKVTIKVTQTDDEGNVKWEVTDVTN